jgi:hypothetical protein
LSSVGERNRVGVFYSRIERVSRDRTIGLGASVADVLAHVIAHEIGHLLLNWKTHSAEGIMRTEWTIVEFAAMRKRKLFFTTYEARAMRRAVQERNLDTQRTEAGEVTSWPSRRKGCQKNV